MPRTRRQKLHLDVVSGPDLDQMMNAENRADAKELAKNTRDAKEMMGDMATVIHDADPELATIATATENAEEAAQAALKELDSAQKFQQEHIKARLLLGIIVSAAVSLLAGAWFFQSLGGNIGILAAAGAVTLLALGATAIFATFYHKKKHANKAPAPAELDNRPE